MASVIERFVVQNKKNKKFLFIHNLNGANIPIWVKNVNEARFYTESHSPSFWKDLTGSTLNINDLEIKSVEISFKVK